MQPLNIYPMFVTAELFRLLIPLMLVRFEQPANQLLRLDGVASEKLDSNTTLVRLVLKVLYHCGFEPPVAVTCVPFQTVVILIGVELPSGVNVRPETSLRLV